MPLLATATTNATTTTTTANAATTTDNNTTTTNTTTTIIIITNATTTTNQDMFHISNNWAIQTTTPVIRTPNLPTRTQSLYWVIAPPQRGNKQICPVTGVSVQFSDPWLNYPCLSTYGVWSSSKINITRDGGGCCTCSVSWGVSLAELNWTELNS